MAVRLAIAYPQLVKRLVLAWPATGGDPLVDERNRARLISQGASEAVADGLLAAETLRGARDDQLAGLDVPVAVLPSVPENPVHQRKTVDSLLKLIPECRELPGCPEPPHPNFPSHQAKLVESFAAFAL
ncbi:hypothetical protein AB0P21_20595 [Kribbella sp. NPDC056861]|uniref:alpha/beta fold hydrolase n=1 Tax=Kribbella sp. NPDC056861 TaxID=3154857 RepID=UPI00342A7698